MNGPPGFVGEWVGALLDGDAAVGGGLAAPLEVADAAGGDLAKEQGEDDRTDDGDEDGVEEAACSGVAEGDHDEAADDGSDDADDDVDQRAEADAAHDASGEVASHEADDQPNQQRVCAFGGLDVAVDIDVMDVRFHGGLLCAAMGSDCGRRWEGCLGVCVWATGPRTR